MTMIINPGSGEVPESGEGWTNTYTEARREAQRWLVRMHKQGLTDVLIVKPDGVCKEGRWRFGFQHTVTGVVVWLETPGIDDLKAYRKERIWDPRVYWKGSSCSDPELEDWAAEGFVPLRTFVKAD